jgi:hypothetical protein
MFNGVAPRIDLSYQRKMEIDRLLIIYSVKHKHCKLYYICYSHIEFVKDPGSYTVIKYESLSKITFICRQLIAFQWRIGHEHADFPEASVSLHPSLTHWLETNCRRQYIFHAPGFTWIIVLFRFHGKNCKSDRMLNTGMCRFVFFLGPSILNILMGFQQTRYRISDGTNEE